MEDLLIFIFLLSYASLEANAQCTIAQTCVSDLTQADCREGEVLVQNSTIFGCCPSCQAPSGIDDETCKPPANCLPDGRYAPVQCKGDLFTGRCFCSDENGRRIFGQMWRSEATEMTCGELRTEYTFHSNRMQIGPPESQQRCIVASV